MSIGVANQVWPRSWLTWRFFGCAIFLGVSTCGLPSWLYHLLICWCHQFSTMLWSGSSSLGFMLAPPWRSWRISSYFTSVYRTCSQNFAVCILSIAVSTPPGSERHRISSGWCFQRSSTFHSWFRSRQDCDKGGIFLRLKKHQPDSVAQCRNQLPQAAGSNEECSNFPVSMSCHPGYSHTRAVGTIIMNELGTNINETF